MADKPFVLIVDDDKNTADTISKVLKRSNKYTPLTAYSGKEALKIIEERNKGLLKRDKDKIKLVLLDIRMPEMDGIETLGKISEIDKDLKTIMVTAYDEDDYWDDTVLVLGAIDYLIKPVSNEELISTLDRFFAGEEKFIRSSTLGKYRARNIQKEIEERKKYIREAAEAQTESLRVTANMLEELIKESKDRIKEIEEERNKGYLPPESSS